MTAGGHVLSGEFGFEALIREVNEELEITLNKNNLIFLGSSISINIKGDIELISILMNIMLQKKM